MNKKYIKETRINGEVKKEISRIIREEIKDPRVPEITSVIDVQVTGDLKFAKIFISVLGNDDKKAEAMKGIKSASAFIRSQLARNVNLRNTPELIFVLDESIEYGVEMSKKIAELGINEDVDKNNGDLVKNDGDLD